MSIVEKLRPAERFLAENEGQTALYETAPHIARRSHPRPLGIQCWWCPRGEQSQNTPGQDTTLSSGYKVEKEEGGSPEQGQGGAKSQPK